MLQRQIANRFLDTFRHISHGAIQITMPDGTTHDFSGKEKGAEAMLEIHDRRAIMAFAQKADIGFAESYREGWWSSPDLIQLFQFGLENEVALDRYIYGNVIARFASRIAYFFTRNSLKGSQKNIQAHYDLSNDFYSLWLDPSMTYSSAIFEDPNERLTDAQNRKYDRIIERLDGSGRLLEIGCGWGGFASRALEKGDYDIKGLTLSKAQHAYATQKLQKDAQISLEDYRIQKGSYNQIVSIEMFEAVGEKFWPVYFSQVKSLLADKGKAMIQTITIKDEYFARYRKGGDPIRTFIFPGGMLPSSERFTQESGRAGLSITDQFSFGKDYALTLKHWLDRFEQKLDEVRMLGFNDAFIRMWRFYLTCCIASFNVGRTDVVQVELQHAS